MDLIFLSLRFSLVCPIRIFWNRSATATHTLRHRHFTAGVNFDRILAFFSLFISLNYAFFLLVFIQHQLDYITKSGKLKSKIKTYQIWKYRIACTGLVIYFEFKAKKPANSNENFNAIKQKKVQRQMLFYYRPNQQWTLFMHQFDEWRIMMNMI